MLSLRTFCQLALLPSTSMTKATILLLSLYLASFILSKEISERGVPSAGYYNPADSGGSMLTVVPQTHPDGQREPVNAIISGNSDQAVLAQQSMDRGLMNYFPAVAISATGTNQHTSNSQQVDSGDSNENETAVMQYNYGDPALGSCTESFKRDDHFQYWVQNSSEADSGAIFLAISYKTSSSDQHNIIENRYNLGCNYVLGSSNTSKIPTLSLTGSTSFSGSLSSQGYTYKTDIIYVMGLLPNTSIGINYNQSVSNDSAVNTADGLITVFNVSITERPSSASNKGSGLRYALSPLQDKGTRTQVCHASDLRSKI
ncbi:uncharacterized protein BT62DRAFT_969236 [Guyanagaster necrorhizus]|uniref:Uncharacterized protein n=1 Tax=Guyanagaster necrorhizus TaxID=856835 RepID=A0A9P8ARN5_9AGAR|nr:uncharacterized protein BT62DRAFT_969236 [Guyanagaster necrorhizus MCA 3950]KAG7445563.1 hypothetical protein BT62DRAFT_969236 [Guyanagaster necrorhizus MCA 3950]